MTTTIELDGRITEEGELELSLPAGLPAGNAHITIEIAMEPEWSQEELDQLLRVEPMTGSEIVAAGLTGGWKNEGIKSGTEWVEQQRLARREQRRW